MTNKFNVGDTVKYTSPYDKSSTLGVVKMVDTLRSDCHHGTEAPYNIEFTNGSTVWISSRNLSLEITAGDTTIHKAKELKTELESKILRLIQEFNKKTNLEVNDIDLNCYKALGGGCFYQVVAKVEI